MYRVFNKGLITLFTLELSNDYQRQKSWINRIKTIVERMEKPKLKTIMTAREVYHPADYARPFDYTPPDTHLLAGQSDCIFQDAHIWIVCKPAGLLSVDGKAEHHKDSLAARMSALDSDARIVHRLDMATSGLIIFARNAHALRHVGLQFEKRHIEKRYIADVAGHVKDDNGTIEAAMICDWPRRPIQMIDPDKGRKAVTHWEVISRGESSTRLALTPMTGRSHQLRVHMLYLGHPILGDRLYAPDKAFAAASRLHLHAEWISLFHPVGGTRTEFTAPCPF